MAAGVTDRLWEIADIVKLLDWYRDERMKEGSQNSQKAIEQSYNPFGPALGQ